MYINSCLLVTQLYMTVLLKPINGYVLLAANMADFKSIARKFVPEDLVNQLAELASKTSRAHADPNSNSHDSAETNDDISEMPGIRREKKALKLTKLKFEELVERVKQRLQAELALKTTEAAVTIRSTRQRYSSAHSTYDDTTKTRHRPATRKHTVMKKPQRTIKKKVTVKQDDEYDYKNPDGEVYKLIHDVHVSPKKNSDTNKEDNMFFSKVEMLKKDSYEDYVTPAKEEKIFDSAADDKRESKEMIVKAANPTNQTGQQSHDLVETIEPDEDIPLEDAKDFREYVGNPEEPKAKTGDLWYDYNSKKETEDEKDVTTPIGKTTKKRQGTMFPKRDYYKISSPNYLAKIPVVAEGYNFDEPLPERDREPENYERLLPLPPSKLNGKIAFSK